MVVLAAQSPFVEISGSFPLLSLVTFLPAIGAVFVALTGKDNPRAARATGIFFSVLAFVVSLFVWRHFANVAGFQLVDRMPWIDGGIGYALGVDGISILLVMLTTFLTPLTLLSTNKAVTRRVREFIICILILETAMLGTLMSLDLFLFYVFWEAMLIPMYLLIGVWGGTNRIYATMKFFLYTMVGSVLMLVAIIYIYLKTSPQSSALVDALQVQFSMSEQMWLFAAFALAFAIKVPLFPFHTWLPDAHTEAPTAGSVILAGVLLKMGTYGFLRFALPLFPEAAGASSSLIMGLAVVGILYGAFVAYAQEDVKKLVAYSSVSHLGFVMLGMFAMTQSAVEGSILQMVNHGISTGGLFLCVGILYERRHTRMIADYGGMAKQIPIFATFFLIVTLSSIGLPGTNGFVGEFLILAGTFGEALGSHLDLGLPFWELITSWRVLVTVFAVLATMGVIFAAVYMLSMYRRVMFGPITHEENKKVADLSGREIGYLTPLVILIFLIGLWPNIFLDKMHKSVDAFISATKPAMTSVRSPETTRAKKSRRVATGGVQ
ncbi:MAG TPA: NADH-quinone oxidoreductase subunit M [Myxococcales bacterium]|nr:NADH-quinone oxidoreductase subunit M [Myxococcales bacterium]HIN85105.1 NADH-quinone oxidoreductase subunit M [Myxococcales bacterium]